MNKRWWEQEGLYFVGLQDSGGGMGYGKVLRSRKTRETAEAEGLIKHS